MLSSVEVTIRIRDLNDLATNSSVQFINKTDILKSIEDGHPVILVGLPATVLDDLEDSMKGIAVNSEYEWTFSITNTDNWVWDLNAEKKYAEEFGQSVLHELDAHVSNRLKNIDKTAEEEHGDFQNNPKLATWESPAHEDIDMTRDSHAARSRREVLDVIRVLHPKLTDKLPVPGAKPMNTNAAENKITPR